MNSGDSWRGKIRGDCVLFPPKLSAVKVCYFCNYNKTDKPD